MIHLIGNIILCLVFSCSLSVGVAGLYHAFKDKYEVKMDRNIHISASIILILFAIIIGIVIL